MVRNTQIGEVTNIELRSNREVSIFIAPTLSSTTRVLGRDTLYATLKCKFSPL